ncbi:hypothetical protein HGM15179_007645 [Zosterops borbonicus]|uniref:Uncharacterized protein n=1 Tax=Zosterops borbonicus TaxID=364589 RepID=A0A8K1GKQ3_9PASS|nr:hypothetical protein HGM15179_007645 [Zosterops borbonicus]
MTLRTERTRNEMTEHIARNPTILLLTISYSPGPSAGPMLQLRSEANAIVMAYAWVNSRQGDVAQLKLEQTLARPLPCLLNS